MTPPKKRARRHRRSWSDLPHDLLRVILDRLTPAFGDRVRFRGVCQAWRVAELARPRPLMPWLVAPGHCVSLHDASIHRVPLPEDATAAICRGSLGDWLALVPPAPTGRPFLLNVVIMERIKLPRWKKMPLVKLVLSSAPDSENCTVAAIVENEDGYEYSMRIKIVVCSLRGQERRWRTITTAFNLHDIIFFEGKLHALHGEARIHVFQDDDLQRDEPWTPPNYVIRRLDFHGVAPHLVVLHGRLLVVARAFGETRVPGCAHYTCAVGVFALVIGDETAKRPQPVKDLGGHAIFVGDACCKAIAVGASSSGSGGKIRENQVCFVDDEKNLSSLAAYCVRPFRQLQSYDVSNGCLRTYRPPEPSSGSSGTWRCVTVQRFPHSRAMRPPLQKALSEAEQRLWDMTNCLGATYWPSCRSLEHASGSRVTVRIRVPKSAAIRDSHSLSLSFIHYRSSSREARQAAAHEATTFLRSRFRSVFDDSPWTSVPQYHSHVEEEETHSYPNAVDLF